MNKFKLILLLVASGIAANSFAMGDTSAEAYQKDAKTASPRRVYHSRFTNKDNPYLEPVDPDEVLITAAGDPDEDKKERAWKQRRSLNEDAKTRAQGGTPAGEGWLNLDARRPSQGKDKTARKSLFSSSQKQILKKSLSAEELSSLAQQPASQDAPRSRFGNSNEGNESGSSSDTSKKEKRDKGKEKENGNKQPQALPRRYSWDGQNSLGTTTEFARSEKNRTMPTPPVEPGAGVGSLDLSGIDLDGDSDEEMLMGSQFDDTSLTQEGEGSGNSKPNNNSNPGPVNNPRLGLWNSFKNTLTSLWGATPSTTTTTTAVAPAPQSRFAQHKNKVAVGGLTVAAVVIAGLVAKSLLAKDTDEDESQLSEELSGMFSKGKDEEERELSPEILRDTIARNLNLIARREGRLPNVEEEEQSPSEDESSETEDENSDSIPEEVIKDIITTAQLVEEYEVEYAASLYLTPLRKLSEMLKLDSAQRHRLKTSLKEDNFEEILNEFNPDINARSLAHVVKNKYQLGQTLAW